MRRRNVRPRSDLRPAQGASGKLPSTNAKTGVSGEKPCQVFSQLFCNFFRREPRRSVSRVVAREQLRFGQAV